MNNSEHWYTRDGSPCYQLRGKDDRPRPVTLRDARKMALVPSVTTVLGVVAKPQLEAWKVKQGVMAALTLSRDPGESDDDYIARLLEDSKQQAIAAAQEGTQIHDAIERAFNGNAGSLRYDAHVTGACRALFEAFPNINDWIPERSFSSPLGYGGKVDLFSPSTGIIVDWKGKDGDFTDGKRLAYDQHWQLAAYQRGLGFNPGVMVSGFVSRTHPGAVKLHIWDSQDAEEGLRVFDSALALWRAMRGYDPRYLAEEAA